ncbi:SMI1/KNR4 family protein [Thermoactinospora rubra]|uniref:SMI1/KNR4 family protein n=1 Tax=Thermoactinospora rubra TaxID=1088767 RepID=UPI001981D0C9|nr:SMI1/KNR4 family protein [Thermoactinospora rubra]
MIDFDDPLTRVATRAAAETTTLPPVLSSEDIARAESTLGFPLHPLLAQLYKKIGNGGFGPEYGILGLTEGGHTSDAGLTAVEEYRQRRAADPSEPGWFWPEGVLPILTWGCAMYACVDCRSEAGTVLLFEPNPVDDGRWADAWFVDSPSLAEWLDTWTRGLGWYEDADNDLDMPRWEDAAGRA